VITGVPNGKLQDSLRTSSPRHGVRLDGEGAIRSFPQALTREVARSAVSASRNQPAVETTGAFREIASDAGPQLQSIIHSKPSLDLSWLLKRKNS